MPNDESATQREWPAAPRTWEPPLENILDAMVKFANAVANGPANPKNHWWDGGPLATTQRGWSAFEQHMSEMIRDDGVPQTAAEWAVYRAQQIGFIRLLEWHNPEENNYCGAFVETTPDLMEWWSKGCPLDFVKTKPTIERKPSVRRTGTTKGSNGRPPIEGKQSQQRLRLWDDWQAAKAAGIEAKDFCKDQKPKLSVPELDKIGDWIATRRRRGQH